MSGVKNNIGRGINIALINGTPPFCLQKHVYAETVLMYVFVKSCLVDGEKMDCINPQSFYREDW